MWCVSRSNRSLLHGTGASMKWDYDLEDPHQDARGFRAEELLQDTDEAAYYELDKNRPCRLRRSRATSSSATGPVSTTTCPPEYSTPECSTLREILAQDNAGERILHDVPAGENPLKEGQQARLTRTTPISSATPTGVTITISWREKSRGTALFAMWYLSW